MKIIFLTLVLLLSFQGYSDSMNEMINQAFERQREMMKAMMKDDTFDSIDSLDSFGSLEKPSTVNIDSKILTENGVDFEVVTIKVDGEVSTFDINVDEVIKVVVTSNQTQSNQGGSYTSHSSSSQIIPKPRGGVYLPDKTKKASGQTSLYFKVPRGKLAENYGSTSSARSYFGARPQVSEPEHGYDEQDKAIVVPQRKI